MTANRRPKLATGFNVGGLASSPDSQDRVVFVHTEPTPSNSRWTVAHFSGDFPRFTLDLIDRRAILRFTAVVQTLKTGPNFGRFTNYKRER